MHQMKQLTGDRENISSHLTPRERGCLFRSALEKRMNLRLYACAANAFEQPLWTAYFRLLEGQGGFLVVKVSRGERL